VEYIKALKRLGNDFLLIIISRLLSAGLQFSRQLSELLSRLSELLLAEELSESLLAVRLFQRHSDTGSFYCFLFLYLILLV
jgi:DNA-binding HxlR family transcriptional regulator